MTEAFFRDLNLDSFNMSMSNGDTQEEDSPINSMAFSLTPSSPPTSGYSSEMINSPEDILSNAMFNAMTESLMIQTQETTVQQQTSLNFNPSLPAGTSPVFPTNQQSVHNQKNQMVFIPQIPTFPTLPTLPILSDNSETNQTAKIDALPAGQAQTPSAIQQQQKTNITQPISTAELQKHKKIKKRKISSEDGSSNSDSVPSPKGSQASLPNSSCPEINEQNFVELSPQKILELDSVQIENYIRILNSRRALNATEDKELKKIRRLIKNREYAQMSRDKKRQQMDQVEERLNEALARSAKLEEENQVLRHNLGLIAEATQRDQEFSNRLKSLAPSVDFSILSNNSSIAGNGNPNQTKAQQQQQQQQQFSSGTSSGVFGKRAKTSVGVMSLFVIALAFGVFVNNLPNVPTSSGGVMSGTNNWRTGRVILSMERWYHQYVPAFFHDSFDAIYSMIFDTEEENLLNPLENNSEQLAENIEIQIKTKFPQDNLEQQQKDSAHSSSSIGTKSTRKMKDL